GLREEWTAQGKAEQWDRLQVYLAGEKSAPPYADAAAALGMSEGAVKTAVHRLRKAFGRRLRQEIAETVAGEAEVDEEIRELFEALRR
ncbi:MAG: sigma-70 family RNA polymerase sigma factor, partial [Planctomycetes bacterium]|nr:sigma-70 family RNA polymerase sigma factor [Planctomycetota bacterium]